LQARHFKRKMPRLSFQFFKKDDKKSEKKKKKHQQQKQQISEAPKALPKSSSKGKGRSRKLLRPGSFADKKKKASERFKKRKKKVLQRPTSNSSVGRGSRNAYLDSTSSENLFDAADPLSLSDTIRCSEIPAIEDFQETLLDREKPDSKDYALVSTSPRNGDHGLASTTPRNGDYGYVSTTPRNKGSGKIAERNSSFKEQYYLSEQERMNSGAPPRITNTPMDLGRRSISFDYVVDSTRMYKEDLRKNLSADGIPHFRSEMQFSYDDQYCDDEPVMRSSYTPRSKGLSAVDYDEEPRFTPTSRSGILRQPSHSVGGIGMTHKYFAPREMEYGGGRFDYNTWETPSKNHHMVPYEMCVE